MRPKRSCGPGRHRPAGARARPHARSRRHRDASDLRSEYVSAATSRCPAAIGRRAARQESLRAGAEPWRRRRSRAADQRGHAPGAGTRRAIRVEHVRIRARAQPAEWMLSGRSPAPRADRGSLAPGARWKRPPGPTLNQRSIARASWPPRRNASTTSLAHLAAAHAQAGPDRRNQVGGIRSELAASCAAMPAPAACCDGAPPSRMDRADRPAHRVRDQDRARNRRPARRSRRPDRR